MKTETVKTDAKIYACEFCGMKSSWAQNVELCEIRHKQESCPHKKHFYELQSDGDKSLWSIYGVSVICAVCKKQLEQAHVFDIDPKYIKNAEFQTEVLNLIKKYSKPKQK